MKLKLNEIALHLDCICYPCDEGNLPVDEYDICKAPLRREMQFGFLTF